MVAEAWRTWLRELVIGGSCESILAFVRDLDETGIIDAQTWSPKAAGVPVLDAK